MPISDHYAGGMIERLIVSIITSDPPTGKIEVVGKDAAVIQLSVSPVPVLFRWPKQGEYWIIIRDNGLWRLDSLVENPDSTQVKEIDPGEALIQAENLYTSSGKKFLVRGDVIPIPVKAGIPVDGDFASPPPDGTQVADSLHNRLYTRIAGVWRYAALT